MDLDRRFSMFSSFTFKKNVLDFGCGNGDFLLEIKKNAKKLYAVDIDKQAFGNLKKSGINCYTDMSLLPKAKIDTVFLFHSFEHFNNPILILQSIYKSLKSGGHIIIEVPHAKDILLNELYIEEFKKFTLWSQHLILHTRESLKKMISSAGFDVIKVDGVQRYPLSNHIHWMHSKKPGGYKKLSSIDNKDHTKAYEMSLQRLDATDTLVAYAKKPLDNNKA
jgi:SAM-dependent methyltransferase